MSVIETVIAGFGIVFVLLLLVVYVVDSIVTMYVLKQVGFKHPAVAWIPYFGSIALGLTCDEGDKKTAVFGHQLPTLIVALFPVITLLAGYVPVVGTVLALVVNTILGGTVYSIVYAKMEGKTREECKVIGLVSGLIPLIAFIKFIIYKAKRMPA